MRFLVSSLAMVLVGSASVACGGLIPDRGTLNTILGTNAIYEAFGALEVDDEFCVVVPYNLNSGSVVGEQGPGLIVEGVSFNVTVTNPPQTLLSWCGKTPHPPYDSKYLAASLTATSALEIDFSVDVTACGLDFFQNADNTLNVRVYAPDDTSVVDTLQVDITVDTLVFFGYTETDGIGKLRVWPTQAFDSIPIDSVAFGVPEPSTFLLFLSLAPAAYALQRRKKWACNQGSELPLRWRPC